MGMQPLGERKTSEDRGFEESDYVLVKFVGVGNNTTLSLCGESG